MLSLRVSILNVAIEGFLAPGPGDHELAPAIVEAFFMNWTPRSVTNVNSLTFTFPPVATRTPGCLSQNLRRPGCFFRESQDLSSSLDVRNLQPRFPFSLLD
jgi:hypothetical protein